MLFNFLFHCGECYLFIAREVLQVKSFIKLQQWCGAFLDDNEGSTEHFDLDTTSEFYELEALILENASHIDDSKMHGMIEEKIDKFIDDRNIILKMSIFASLMFVLCLIATYLIYKRLQHPYEHPVILARRRSEMPS